LALLLPSEHCCAPKEEAKPTSPCFAGEQLTSPKEEAKPTSPKEKASTATTTFIHLFIEKYRTTFFGFYERK
jgi:hypothetical protein